MAFTDSNIILTKDAPQDVLLGASTSFIVQNTSAGTINFKIKDSTAAGNFAIDGLYASALDTPRIITIYIASGNEGSNYFTVIGLDGDGNAYSEIIQGPTSTSAKAYSVNRFSKVISITAGSNCTVPVSFGTAFTAEEYKAQFTLQKAWLDENGFTRGWAHWAYPLGEFNSESEQ